MNKKDEDTFLAAIENGDPVRDFFDESEIHEHLEEAIHELRYLRYLFKTAAKRLGL